MNDDENLFFQIMHDDTLSNSLHSSVQRSFSVGSNWAIRVATTAAAAAAAAATEEICLKIEFQKQATE